MYTVYHEPVLASGNDWLQLSKSFHKLATYEERDDFIPQTTYNLMADKNCCYAKIVDKLADYFTFDSMGLSAQNTPPQNRKAVEKLMTTPAFKNMRGGLKKSIINLKNAAQEHTGQKFFLEYEHYDTCLVASDIKAFFNVQLENTGKYLPDDIIVLFGDNEVKKFIESKGAALLKKIPVDRAKTDGMRKDRYLAGYYQQAMEELFHDDWREVEAQKKFPKAFEAFTKINAGIEI